MGRGDIKSKKGKIANGSFGVRRPKRVKKSDAPVATTTAVAATAEKPAKKAKAKA